MHTARIWLFCSCAPGVLVACSSPDTTPQPSRTIRGDTVVVHSQGPGLWGTINQPVELARVTGSQSSSFGEIQRIAVLPDDGVLVFDAKSTTGLALHQFDSAGTFERTIGRYGQGPGEYATKFVDIAAAADGQVFLSDKMQRRVVRFDTSGKYLGDFHLPGPAGRTPDLIPATPGGIYVANDLPHQFFLRIDADGRPADSVPTLEWGNKAESGRADFYSASTVLPDGSLVVMRTDRVGFLILSANSPLMSSIETEPPPYAVGEREELEQMQKQLSRTVNSVESTKALSRDVVTDTNGRIWIRRTAVAQRIPPKVKFWGTEFGKVHTTFEEPPRFAGFKRDGTYLGELQFPLGAIVAFGAGAAWAVLNNDEEPVLVKYRLP
jgi:hypothetical protein